MGKIIAAATIGKRIIAIDDHMIISKYFLVFSTD
jgi:hypothetical protein